MLKKETLATIHELMAQQMLNIVSGSRDEPATAAELNIVRQFLKDNGIDKAVSDLDGEDPFTKLVATVDAEIKDRPLRIVK